MCKMLHRLSALSLFILSALVHLESIRGEYEVSPLAVGIKGEIEAAHSEDYAKRSENDADEAQQENESFDETIINNVKETKANVTVTPNVTKANCLMNKLYGPVELVNATRLMELLILEPGPSNRTGSGKESKQVPGACVLVLFYARWCVFSSQAAPHFNALPRLFPYMKMVAVDAIKYQSFNTQYGIVGVPTLMLVHNGKPVAKFNDTDYTLKVFAKFIMHHTPLLPNGSLYVTSADFGGPVPSTPSNEIDYCLVLSYLFNAACGLYFISQSRWWRQFVDLVQNTWRESNAQHEHTD